MINDAPIYVDDDFRKTLRQRLCANLMGGSRLPVHETRFGKNKRARAQGNQRGTGGMAMTDPGYHAGRDIRIWKVHHGWRDDQRPRLWAAARFAVMDAGKIRVEAIDRPPMRNAKRGLARSPLIERNRGSDAEQIG
jgi:hypothetical protein